MIRNGLIVGRGEPITPLLLARRPNQRVGEGQPVTATMIDRLSATLKASPKGYDADADLILINERHSEVVSVSSPERCLSECDHRSTLCGARKLSSSN